MAKEAKTLTIEDAELIFRNFSGEERMYNAKGLRNFCVIVDNETADRLAADGFNVKIEKPREEGVEGRPYIKVIVNFSIRPPRVVMITSTGRTPLTEETVGALDWVDIKLADLVIRGSEWSQPDGRSGTSAYLQTLFVTVEENDLERKYAQYELEDEEDHG